MVLLEEALASGIPCLVIDPKGDMGNLELVFPDFAPSDFVPWIDPAEAERAGVSIDEMAQQTAETWKQGLADWGVDSERMRQVSDAANVRIYTPGSTAGTPINVLGSLDAPPLSWDENAETLRDEIEGFVSSLLVLVGVEADPVSSPEHILLANLIENEWRAGRNLESPADIGLLIGRELAERLETRLGWRVVLMSEGADNELAERGFPIVGIFEAEPEAMETGYVFTGRAVAQQMLRMGEAVSEIALLAPERGQVDALLPRLRAAAPGLDVRSWTEVEPLLVLTEEVSGVILVIWYVVVFTAMSFGLINTLLMAVFERTREFGLFQALGMRPRQIVGQVLAEALILIGIGLVLGNIAAALTLEWLERGLDLSAFAEGFELAGYSPVLYPSVDAGDVLAANLLVFVLGLAASLYPAWRAARHVPVRALAQT
jgi:ABC-type lipoprotein release transport system permease subunit